LTTSSYNYLLLKKIPHALTAPLTLEKHLYRDLLGGTLLATSFLEVLVEHLEIRSKYTPSRNAERGAYRPCSSAAGSSSALFRSRIVSATVFAVLWLLLGLPGTVSADPSTDRYAEHVLFGYPRLEGMNALSAYSRDRIRATYVLFELRSALR
jgi:hypothetical protein